MLMGWHFSGLGKGVSAYCISNAHECLAVRGNAAVASFWDGSQWCPVFRPLVFPSHNEQGWLKWPIGYLTAGTTECNYSYFYEKVELFP